MNYNKILLAILPRMVTYIPPLAIPLLSACVEEKGYLSECRDLNIELFSQLSNEDKIIFNDEYTSYWLDKNKFNESILPVINFFIKKVIKEFSESDAGIIGFSLNRDNKLFTFEIINKLKKNCPDKIIIIGGPYLSIPKIRNEVVMNPNIDYTFYGESEETLVKFMDWINSGRIKEELDTISGLIYKKDINNNNQNIQCSFIKDINNIPYSKFNKLNLNYYDKVIIPILSSRGCIRKCVFCSEHTFLNLKNLRIRTAINIFNELYYQYQTIGCKLYQFMDSMINANIKELNLFCDLIIMSRIPIEWGGNIIIRNEMTEKLFIKMYDSGCRWLFMGIESGSPSVLKSMNKHYSLATAKKILEVAHDNGIKTGIFMLIGFPTETDEDFQQSIQFIKDNYSNIDEVIAGYGCIIEGNSELGLHPEKFDIY